MSHISIHDVKKITASSRKHRDFTTTTLEVTCDDEIYEKITLFSSNEILTSINGKKVKEEDYSNED